MPIIPNTLPNSLRETFIQVNPADTNIGEFRANTVASGGIWRFNFMIPDDFVSLVSIELTCIPAGTNAASPYDLYSTYGAIGEAYNNNTGTSLGLTKSLTLSNIAAIDISGVFASIAAGDFCGVRIDEGAFGFATRYLGVKLRYNS
jgi:hypothetical protein